MKTRKIRNRVEAIPCNGSIHNLFSEARQHLYLGKKGDKEAYYLEFADTCAVYVEVYFDLSFDELRKQFLQQCHIHRETGCVPEPYTYGYDQRTGHVFLVREWIHGQTLDAYINDHETHPLDDQYAAGARTGLALRTIHAKITPESFSHPEKSRHDDFSIIVADSDYAPAHPNLYKKTLIQDINHYMLAKIPGFLRTDLASFLIDYLHFLPDHSVGVLHQNINMTHAMMSVSGRVRFIGNHHWDQGDPYLEIARLILNCRMMSVNFLTGLLDMYFSNEQSGRSFLLVSIYTASELMRRIIRHANDVNHYKATCQLARAILKDYDHFRRPVPKWYKPLPFENIF